MWPQRYTLTPDWLLSDHFLYAVPYRESDRMPSVTEKPACRYEEARRKSQMMEAGSIEDEDAEAAELADLMSTREQQRRNSVARNGCELERRMSKISKRSHRSSVGGGSNHSFNLGVMTTTTAEVLHYIFF